MKQIQARLFAFRLFAFRLFAFRLRVFRLRAFRLFLVGPLLSPLFWAATAAPLALGLSGASAETLLAPPPLPRSAEDRARIAAVTAPTADFTKPEPFEARPGGATTHLKRPNKDAFSQASANMAFEREMLFKLGNGLFKKLWVAAPASTIASDGLGPLYNARSCQRCHLKDGRGHPPEGPGDSAVSMIMKLAVPAPGGTDVATKPEPTYGGQLQDFAVLGHPAEGRFTLRYEEIPIRLSDGESASLRKPVYGLADLGYGPAAAELLISPRVAPPMIGLGLLEAIPQDALLARADPDDADGDGVSGRARRVESAALGRPALGRFGLKAAAATLIDQSAEAFFGDMGLSTPLHPGGWGACTAQQPRCRAAAHGGSAEHGGVEVSADALGLVAFYARNLAVPPRRDVGDPTVLHGKQIFYESGCIQCHTPKHVTHRFPAEGRRDGVAAWPEQSFQLIWPYTDLLLHDMGAGLADGRPDGAGDSPVADREWRTPPLWGVGLTETVNGHSQLLHDGRARNLLEAVLWHGGEAAAARDRVVQMPKADRAALIRFLESL